MFYLVLNIIYNSYKINKFIIWLLIEILLFIRLKLGILTNLLGTYILVYQIPTKSKTKIVFHDEARQLNWFSLALNTLSSN